MIKIFECALFSMENVGLKTKRISCISLYFTNPEIWDGNRKIICLKYVHTLTTLHFYVDEYI